MTQESSQASSQGQGHSKSRKRAARLVAVQTVYQLSFSDLSVDEAMADYIAKMKQAKKARASDEMETAGDEAEWPLPVQPTLLRHIISGVDANRDALKEMVEAVLDEDHNWDRLELLMQCIFLCAAFELSQSPEVHARIIISDYLSVAHAFFVNKEPAVINRVLDQIARQLRPEEVTMKLNADSEDHENKE